MPYKHKNIEYGLPHEQYPKERIKESIEQLKEVIGLGVEPVGITLLFTKEDYDAYPVEETKTAMPYCVMVKQAALRSVGSKAGWNITNVTAPPRPWAWSPAQSGSRAARSISPISCIPLWPRRDGFAGLSGACTGNRSPHTVWR